MRTYTGLGNQTLEGTDSCVHQDPGERSSDPTRDWPRLACECPGISSRGVGRWWPAAGLGALSIAVHAWDLLKEVTIIFITSAIVGFPCISVSKESSCSAGSRAQSLGWEDPLEKEMATHSSILVWKISWTEEPGGLQSMGSQRVGHYWATNLLTNNREGTQLHPPTENWIKDLLSLAPPIRTRPRFPLSQSLQSGNFHKPLILL